MKKYIINGLILVVGLAVFNILAFYAGEVYNDGKPDVAYIVFNASASIFYVCMMVYETFFKRKRK